MMRHPNDFNKHVEEIKSKWTALHDATPSVFAYKLNVTKAKILPGELQVYCEFNPERSHLRRLPQQITSLDQPFDDGKFNFNKINPKEKLLDLQFGESIISFIINNSPLTKYHSLICPDLKQNSPQKISKVALQFSAEFLLGISDRSFRIGYNSPGALASVNHLHLHLFHLHKELFIERAALEPLSDGISRLAPKYPLEAVCFSITSDNVSTMISKLYEFLQFLCDSQIPHNLHMLKSSPDAIKVFAFAREAACVVKNLSCVNIAFCELSGYVPIGDPKTFEEISEELIVSKYRAEIGGVFPVIYEHLRS